MKKIINCFTHASMVALVAFAIAGCSMDSAELGEYVRKEMQEAMTSMIASPITMEMMVPVGPATGRNVEPGMTKDPQPTAQPKDMAHTASKEKCRAGE